jgi:hypothetical protein
MPKDIENKTNGIDRLDKSKLTEVKGFKKANKTLLKKVSLGIGTILLAIVILATAKSCTSDNKENTLTDDNQPTVSDTVNNDGKTTIIYVPSGNTNNGGTTTSTPTESATPSTTPATTTNNGVTTYPSNEDQWVTGTISPSETPVTSNVEDDEDLTRAQKAYIQEYVDYYDISWEDAKLTYFTYGPLNIQTNTNTNTQEYVTTYIFDAEDEAVIKELMSTLGMTRAEAEYEYVTNIAPSIGKTVQKVSTLKLK